MPDQLKLHMTKRQLIFTYVYYSVIFVIGNCLSLFSITPITFLSIPFGFLELGIIGGIGMSCLGSSIYYIRKLYKSCINGAIVLDSTEAGFLNRLGTVTYYLARPFFSVGFSILIVVGLLSGFMAVSIKDIELKQGFVYVIMFCSFFTGFLAGRFVKILETEGVGFLKRLRPEFGGRQ